ncbi:MAG: hypothetical protein IKP05_04140 [Alphaproteobacteria bacterium]|nr:hypothetical protein [Alphaproteobacteria bacterium]
MAEKLRDILTKYDKDQYAKNTGSQMHKKMRFVNTLSADDEVVKQIKSRPDLEVFFTDNARCEVPIAILENGKLLSRRIDRMVVDDDSKVVYILDYKTDVDKKAFHANYVAQVQEYITIIKKIYPKYKVYGYILWLHDWTLEKL